MVQYNPPHPGEVLWELDMKPAGLTIKEVSERIGVDRKTLSRLINGRVSVSVEMAILLGKVLNTSPDLWLNMQKNYDLWHAEQQMKTRIRHIKPFVSELGAPA